MHSGWSGRLTSWLWKSKLKCLIWGELSLVVSRPGEPSSGLISGFCLTLTPFFLGEKSKCIKEDRKTDGCMHALPGPLHFQPRVSLVARILQGPVNASSERW